MADNDVQISMLFIECDDLTEELFTKYLNRLLPQVSVHHACDRHMAIDLLHNENYDMVVCDASRHSKDKMVFITQLCKEMPSTPILVITTDQNITSDSLCRDPDCLCVKEVIHKPINLQSLISKINNILDAIKTERTSKH